MSIIKVTIETTSGDYEVEVQTHLTPADGIREDDQKLSGSSLEGSYTLELEDGDSLTISAKIIGEVVYDEDQSSVTVKPVEDPEAPPEDKRRR